MDSLTSQPLSGTTPLRCGAQWDSGIHRSKTHLFWKADNWIEDAQKTRWSQFSSTDEFHRDHSKFGRRRTGSSTDHEWSSTPLVLLVSCLLLSSFVCLHRSFGGGSLRLIMEDSLEDIKVQVKLGLIALLFALEGFLDLSLLVQKFVLTKKFTHRIFSFEIYWIWPCHGPKKNYVRTSLLNEILHNRTRVICEN